jgi:hypothetical protein
MSVTLSLNQVTVTNVMSSGIGLSACLIFPQDYVKRRMETIILSILLFSDEAKLTLVPVVAKNRSSQSGLLFH